MLSRYFKSLLYVLARGGIVGPIFLVIYFAMSSFLQQQFGGLAGGADSWMLYLGAIITVGDFVVAFAISAKTQRLDERGVLALAQVTSMSESSLWVNNQPTVNVTLYIAGPGLTPFEAQRRLTASVTRMPMIASRKLVAIVDPATNSFEIDWARTALVSGMAPTTFTSTEDGRTYDLTGQAGPLMEILQVYKVNNIPIGGGAVDLRNYPAVRQQVMAIVRQAAAPQAPGGAPAPPPGAPVAPPAAPPASAAQRLQELETLRASGTISDAEYASKRQQIISAL